MSDAFRWLNSHALDVYCTRYNKNLPKIFYEFDVTHKLKRCQKFVKEGD